MNERASDGVNREVAIDPPSLLGDDYETFESVLSGETTGPLAVVGDPFAGRSTVLDRAEDALEATRVTLSPGDGIERIRAAHAGGPIVVEHCQHLYHRCIGGFDELSAFLDDLATMDATAVTGWNRYAWAYLDAVQHLGREFPRTVEVQPLPTARIADLVRSRYDELPTFVDDDADSGGLFATRHHEIEWHGRSVSVPVPLVRPAVAGSLFSTDGPDPEDVTFGRLAALSEGNLGVATSIWETQDGAELRPSDIAVPASDLNPTREEAFCLRILLAKERADRTRLSEIIDGLTRILARLSRDGLVSAEDGIVELVPAAVPAAAAATDRERVL